MVPCAQIQASHIKPGETTGCLGPWGKLSLGYKSSSQQPKFSFSNCVLHSQVTWVLQDISPATAYVTF